MLWTETVIWRAMNGVWLDLGSGVVPWCRYAQMLGLDSYAAVLRVGLGPTTPP
jgi:hypothetical protein